MKTSLRLLFAVVIAGTLGASLSGCTIVFTGVGSVLNQATEHPAYTKPAQPESLPNERSVSVTLVDSTMITGTYCGQTRLPDSLYMPRLKSHLGEMAPTAAFPLPGDTLMISRSFGGTFTARFAGYSPRALRFFDPAAGDQTEVPFVQLTSCKNLAGTEYSLDTLDRLSYARRLPSPLAIRIRGDTAATTIPLDDVRSAIVYVPAYRPHFKTIGFISGLVVDAIIATILIVQFSGNSGESFITYSPGSM